MGLEKQRGISITSSVMQFPYNGKMVNLLDTSGHEDFSEDTYRTLTAEDSALMVMERDARRMRGERPFVFTNLKSGEGVETVIEFIVRQGML